MKISGRIRIDIIKPLFALSVLYTNFVAYKFFQIPGLSALLIYGTFFLACALYKSSFFKLIRSDKIMISLLLFLGINFITSFLLAADRKTAIWTLGNITEFIAGIITIALIIEKEGNMRYMAKLMAVLAFLMGLFTLIAPVNFIENYTGRGTVYYTFSSSVNPHTVGVMQVLGIWAVLILQSYQKKHRIRDTVFVTGIILFFLFCIVMTNSRKGIIAALLLILMALRPYIKQYVSRLNKRQKITIVAAVLAAAAWVVIDGRLIELFMVQNNLLERLTVQMTGSSNQSRLKLIQEGLTIFIRNPIFGVGINNTRHYSIYNTYMHNTYVELLGCCGIVGSVPLIAALYYVAKYLLKRSYSRELRPDARYRRSLTTIYLLVLLFIAFTQIVFYERGLMLAFAIVIGYARLLRENAVGKRHAVQV